MRLVHLFLILFSFCTVVTESAETCQQPSMLIRFMQRYHYSPRELNTASENNVFELFISSLDPDRLLFTSSDVDSLKKYVPGILDTNRQVSCLFVSKSGEVYRRRLIECDSIFASALKKEFQFLATDTLYFLKERKYQFASGRKEIDARRMKSLKYDFLSDLFDQADDSLTPAMINSLVKEREREFRERVVSAERCELQQRMNPTGGFEKAVMNNFLNAIAHLYDPHSDYFSMEENNSFATSLSVEAQSFGFQLTDEDGKIKINKLVPGGPAWKSNKIHKGDILLKISTADRKTDDLSCMHADQVQEMINSGASAWAEMELIKSDGHVEKVKILREKMRVEDNNVNSCILNGKIKAGYISLPDFYTSPDMKDARGCANDVAKEILKLQRSGIEGLILDLRYNGGGSIEEAIDLAGIFIDAGPLAFMKFRNAKPVVLKDMNRGMVFGGKLLVLVNGLSASASEFVAGILQDYNRAIIAGSPTYGKATSQIVLPLNLRENISSNSSATDGYVKVTEGKLYRLDGESNQVRGVVPDILLPDLYEGILPREEDSGNFLIRDTINKKTPYSALPSLEREKLRRNSENRITKNIVLANTVEKNKELNISYHNTKVVLMPEPFYKWKKHVDSYFNTETKTLSSDKQFKVESNTFDKSLMELDEFRRDFIRQNNENILQDAEVGEAYSILEDMITFSR